MGVYIPNMEMPKNCDSCRFQHRSYDTFVKFCQYHLDNNVYDIDEIIKQRHPNCPLVEVDDDEWDAYFNDVLTEEEYLAEGCPITDNFEGVSFLTENDYWKETRNEYLN